MANDSVITGGVCPTCKQTVGLVDSKLDPDDCFGVEDTVVLAEHEHDGKKCEGSGKHTEHLLCDEEEWDDHLMPGDIDPDEEEPPPITEEWW